jgi:hypothetical protein
MVSAALDLRDSDPALDKQADDDDDVDDDEFEKRDAADETSRTNLRMAIWYEWHLTFMLLFVLYFHMDGIGLQQSWKK